MHPRLTHQPQPKPPERRPRPTGPQCARKPRSRRLGVKKSARCFVLPVLADCTLFSSRRSRAERVWAFGLHEGRLVAVRAEALVRGQHRVARPRGQPARKTVVDALQHAPRGPALRHRPPERLGAARISRAGKHDLLPDTAPASLDPAEPPDRRNDLRVPPRTRSEQRDSHDAEPVHVHRGAADVP
jgi:hypothetical protein